MITKFIPITILTLNAEGECHWPSTILLAIYTHGHLFVQCNSQAVGLGFIKPEQVSNTWQTAISVQHENIYNLYIKYTFSVNDFP